MNRKEMTTSIVMVMVVVGIFAAMIGPASAGTISLYKETHPDPDAVYDIGQEITYKLMVTNTNLGRTATVNMSDQFPNMTAPITIAENVFLQKYDDTLFAGDDTWIGYVTYVVDVADIQPDGKVWNYLTVDGFDSGGGPVGGTVSEDSVIRTIITLDFVPEATGCMEMKFTGSSTGSVAWHRWNFGDGQQSLEISGAPNAGNAVTHPYTSSSCGDKTVRLYGESLTSDPAEEIKTVYVACEPVVDAGTYGCVKIGDSVTFTSSISTTKPGTPPYSYLWTFTNGVTGSSDTLASTTCTIPAGGTTATLNVTDNLGCYDTDIASVSICSPPLEPPSDVPILTPTGMVALIGMLCIAGAGRILTKGRRS